MDIDAMKLDAVTSIDIIEKMDLTVLPLSALFAVEALRKKLVDNIALINAIQHLRRSHPEAALKIELYLQGIE